MSMADLEQALSLVAEHADDADFVGPRDEDLIARAEQALGVTFPPSYRRFHAELGAGDLEGEEFYGVITDDWSVSPPDAIGRTLDERDEIGLPDEYVVVAETPDGGWYLLDTARQDSDGESPVVLWMPGASPEDAPPEDVADNFGAFMRERLAKAV
jgi:antitoxin YobK